MDLKMCYVLISLEENSASLYNCNHHATGRKSLKHEVRFFFQKSKKKLLKVYYGKYE